MTLRKIGRRRVFFGILFSLAGIMLLLQLIGYLQCYYFVQKIPQDNGQILRIMLFGSSETPDGETVSAKISILDRSGSEIAAVERSWPQLYLAVTFRNASFLNKTYFFPERIFGTNSVAVSRTFFKGNSTSYIVRYFVKEHKCFLGADDFQRKGLFRIFYFAVNKTTVSLSECETGKIYGVFAENGRLIVRSE